MHILRIACAAIVTTIPAATLPAAAQARPLLIEESQVIANPDAARYPLFGGQVATNGSDALVLAYDTSIYDQWFLYVLRYRRVAGIWTFQGEVLSKVIDYDGDSVFPSVFALRGDLAVLALQGGPAAYRLTATGLQFIGNVGGFSEDIEIEGNRIALGEGEAWHARVADVNSDGSLTSSFLQGQPRPSDDENWGGPVDLSGDRVIIGTPNTYDLEPQEIPIYQRSASGAWELLTKLQVPSFVGGLGGPVALNNLDAIVDGVGGPHVWRLPPPGQPVYPNDPTDQLRSLDAYSTLPFNDAYPDIEKSAGRVLVQRPSAERTGTVINVFQIGASERYEHVATLAAKNGVSMSGSFDVVGNTVLARGNDRQIHVFDLPASFATPAPQYDNFENGATRWAPQPGAQFAVATSGTNRLYRQSSLAGDARALLTDTNWRDQSIETDIRPTGFSGSDRWVGLITRYQDAQNFWYVTLRSSGSVALRRMRAGTITEVARAPLVVTVNRSYRVRLETVGTEQRVYVDGKLLLEADDASATQSGSAGLAMYRASADFDNVVVTPSRHTTILARDFTDQYSTGPFIRSGTGQWTPRSGAFAQDSIAGDARAAGGTPTDDQVVEARVQPTAYAPASGTQERWSGILARYRDAQNYYYLSLRSSNTVSLRKLVNGVITPLATAPFTVNINAPHTLRLEVVGNQLRGYVDGVLRVQATDTSHASGSGGLVTYKAAAIFDDYVAYQP